MNKPSSRKLLEKIQQARAIKQSRLPRRFMSPFDVDLGTRTILLRFPKRGAVYTKGQCLNAIKNTTVKGTIERGKLIRFMATNEFVPSKTGLYKLLERDEKGELIIDENDNNWGMTVDDNKAQQYFEGNMFMDNEFVRLLPRGELIYTQRPIVQKELRLLGKVHVPHGEFVQYNLHDRKGWRGRLRLWLVRTTFCDEDVYATHDYQWVNERNHGNYPLLDICEYIGSSDFFHGTTFDEEACTREGRVHNLYFPLDTFPAPDDVDSGCDNNTFTLLKLIGIGARCHFGMNDNNRVY
mmetsp:Transcript_46349/g.98288  ORF Transcript_46349/g.98288 Transcript_46349/m.98288 type:complete len:295 (+) Transcript_46349:180-1064(+)